MIASFILFLAPIEASGWCCDYSQLSTDKFGASCTIPAHASGQCNLDPSVPALSSDQLDLLFQNFPQLPSNFWLEEDIDNTVEKAGYEVAAFHVELYKQACKMGEVSLEIKVDNRSDEDVHISLQHFALASGTAFAPDGKKGCKFSVIVGSEFIQANSTLKVVKKQNPDLFPVPTSTQSICCMDIDESQRTPGKSGCNQGFRSCLVMSNTCDVAYNGTKMCLKQNAGRHSMKSSDCSYDIQCDDDDHHDVDQNKARGGTLWWVWLMLALLIVGAGAIYYWYQKKKQNENNYEPLLE